MKRIRRFVKRFMLLLGGVAFLLPDSFSQCVIDTSIIVEPIDTAILNIEIEGLLNDDLSDPGQGLCGVRLAFEHEYIGDIYIELISPSGQSVRLIGPEVTSGFTNLTNWDILFVPCGFPTAPDPGFSAQWDNDQTWGILNNYSGTYHPYSGCLEDFNTGSANGNWTFRIVDRSPFYGGEITSVTLIFCDPSGLDCNPCNANAGTWINEGIERTFCEGDPDLLLDTSLQYSGLRPDTNIYGFAWAIASPDTIDQIILQPDLRAFLPGTYTVCGLSYRRDEVALLPNSSDSIHIDSLKIRLGIENAPFCGQLTSGCMIVNIVAPPDTVDISANICQGDYFVWKRDTFYSTGTYLVNQPFIGNCDSVFRIDLQLVELEARISGPDTLNCDNSSITLDGSGSDTVQQTNFSWSLGGNAIDPGQNDSDVEITRGGLLQMIISAGGCTDTASVFIHTDTIKPNVSIITDTLGCEKDSLWIRSVIAGDIRNFSWSGPGIQAQFQDSALITLPGNYLFTVESKNGCDSTIAFEVIEDKNYPDFELKLDTLTCANDTIIPNIDNRIPGTKFSWSGPQGFNFEGIDPKLTVEGTYELSTETSVGCRFDTSFIITADFEIPQFSLTGGRLMCQPDSIQLEVSPFDPSLTYQWTGPSSFSSIEAQPFVRVEGQYILRVTGRNGCIGIDTVVITKTDDVPDIEYVVEDIDCLTDMGSIRAQSPTGISFIWLGPNNFSSNDPEINGLEAGTYFLTVTDASGCENTRVIEVSENTDPPLVSLSGDTINCDSPISILSFVSNDTIENFFWIAPDNSTFNDSSLSVSLPGEYVFLARGTNGCVTEDTLFIEIDTLPPSGNIFPANITCEKDSALLKLEDYSMTRSVRWVFPDNSEFLLDSVHTMQGGEYIVQVTSNNGCISNDTIYINVDTIAPVINISSGIIDCNDRQTEISILVNSNVRTWTISGPAGAVTDQNLWSVEEPGVYDVEWVGINGCVASDTITVVADTLVPDILLFHENFDCRKKDTIGIGVNTSNTGADFSWTGPGGFQSSKKDTFVSLPGVYLLNATGTNGCSLTDSIRVVYDTIPPAWSYYPIDTLSCDHDSVDLVVNAGSDMVNIAFDAPEGRLINDSTWRTGQPGWILTLVEGQNACVQIDSVEVQIDSIYPQMDVTGGSLTCDEDRIRINAQVAPGGGDIRWIGPGNFTSAEYDPLVAIEGWYIAEYELQNGCTVLDSVFVRSEIFPPGIMINGGILPCDGSAITLMASADTSGVEYVWTGPGGFTFNGPEPEVMLIGEYIVLASGPNGCQSIDTVMVTQASNDALLTLTSDTINCFNQSVNLEVSSVNESLEYNWEGPAGYIGIGDSVEVNLGGWYYIDARDSLGCSAIDSIFIETDSIVAQADIQLQQSLGCGVDSASLIVIFQGNMSSTEWRWIDPAGNEFGAGEDSVTVTLPGEYAVFLLNRDNGCESKDTIEVKASNGRLEVAVIGEDPTCPGRNDGLVMIGSVTGNNGPWEVFVNGVGQGDETDFSGLRPGDFYILIEDSTGCKWDSMITLTRPDTLWVDLGPDLTINAGNSVNLDPRVNPGASGVQVTNWDPEDPQCPFCLTRLVSPNSTTRYTLTIQDERGCTASDDILISLKSQKGIFLPNAFTPNGDGVNDNWIISVGEGIEAIHSLQIFDRWGNLVHSLSGFPVVDGLSLWDGSANGEELNPGVFVFSITYQTVDGATGQITGDITLIR